MSIFPALQYVKLVWILKMLIFTLFWQLNKVMQWVLFILVVYVNEQLLSASMDIVCRVHGGFVQVKDADYISCQTSNCTSTEHFFFYLFLLFYYLSLPELYVYLW